MKPLFAGLAGVLMMAAVPLAAAGLYEDIFHGLDYVVTPLGSPTFASGDGGAQNGARSGRLRIVPNRLGQGYRLEMDRSFGVDTLGRPEVYDVGPYELQLSGSMQATAGFTTRFMLIGNTDVSFSNLNYTLREKSGAQDATVTGTLNGVQQMEVNRLGFYTLRLDLSNSNSALNLDGVAVGGTRSTNWDVGPISVKGNIYYDAALSVLDTLGVDTSQLAQVFPKSPIDRISQEIQNSLASQAAKQLQGDLTAATLNGTQDAALAQRARSFLQTIAGLPDAGLSDGGGRSDLPAGISAGGATTVPEPAALALLAGGGLLLLRRR